jgi:tetratricopeptide (TPR) repeat protein
VLAGGLAMTAWAGIGDRARAQCRDDAATRTLLEPSDTAAIEASFGATGRPFSADAAAHATARLHELDATWREARVEACDAGPLLDARLACLDDRRGRTQAIVARLRDADAELVGRAFRIVEALPTVADCARVTEDPLAGLPEPTAEQVQRLTLRLAQAEADLDAGHHDEGLATARSVRDAAAQIEHPPLHARADLVVGSLLAAAGEYGTSAEDLERAYFVAEQAGDDVIAFEAAARLVTIVGNDLARPDDGRTWARHAEAACDRMGRPRLRRANLLSNLSRVEFEQGHYDEAYALVGEARQIYREHEPRGLREARATLNIGAIQDARGHLDEAIATYEDAREMFRDIGAKLPEVATVTNNLGIVRSKRGEPETGLQLLKSALQLRREIYGEDHPEVAAALGNVGIALRRLGRYDEALETMEATTVAFERIHGPDHPMVASAVFNEGTALHDLGRDEAAKVKCERGVEIWERTLGPEHPMVANGIAVVAIIHNDLGDPDEALRLHNRALDIRRKVLRPDHPDIALSLGHIGTVYQKTDRCAEAIPLFEQQEIATVVSAGDDSGSLAFPLTARGYCEVELRRYEAAVGTLERALALRPEGSGDPAVRAETLFHLARARWAAGDDRDRARALATEAAAAWAQAGPGRAEDVTMARAWLAAHR